MSEQAIGCCNKEWWEEEEGLPRRMALQHLIVMFRDNRGGDSQWFPNDLAFLNPPEKAPVGYMGWEGGRQARRKGVNKHGSLAINPSSRQSLVFESNQTVGVVVWLRELQAMLMQAALSLCRCVSSLALEGTMR